jgi:hypothetical protein
MSRVAACGWSLQASESVFPALWTGGHTSQVRADILPSWDIIWGLVVLECPLLSRPIDLTKDVQAELLDGFRTRINVGRTAAATARTNTTPNTNMHFLDMCVQTPNRSTHQRRVNGNS